MANHLDSFTRGYLPAALFTEDPDPGQGEYPARTSIGCRLTS